MAHARRRRGWNGRNTSACLRPYVSIQMCGAIPVRLVPIS